MSADGRYERPMGQGGAQPPITRVFVGQPRLLTLAEAKRARFIQNLRHNHERLKEAMAFFERFAVICELSPQKVQAIRRANQEALDELSRIFDAKLAGYDRLRSRR